MTRTQFFGQIIRFWSESQSYSTEVRVTARKSELQPHGPPKSDSNRPKHVSESDFGSSARKDLEAFKAHKKKSHKNSENPIGRPGVPGTPGRCPGKHAFLSVNFLK